MNIRRVTLLLLCIFLLGFTGVVHGANTILNQTFTISNPVPILEFPFDLSAGDNITISVAASAAINFRIESDETGVVYSKPSISLIDDVWTVPADDYYTFQYEWIGTTATVDTVIGSDIIPEFPSLALLLASLTIVAIAGFLYKKKLKS